MVNVWQPVNFGGGMGGGGVVGVPGSVGGGTMPSNAGMWEGLQKIAMALINAQQQKASGENIQEAIKAGQGWTVPGIEPGYTPAPPSDFYPDGTPKPAVMRGGGNAEVPAGARVGGGIEAIAAGLAKNADPRIRQMAVEMTMRQAMQKPEGFTLGQGQTRYGPNGVPIASAPGRQEGFTLPPGSGRFDQQGKLIAAMPDRAAKDPALERKIQVLVESGVDRNTAIGIAAGRLVTSRDPINGNAQIIDKATGKVVGAAPQATVAAAEGIPPTAMKPQTDYSQGTGTSGFVGWGLNTLADLFGGKLAAPDTEKAIQGLKNLQVSTQLSLQAGVPGRPSKYLMERLDELAIAPGSLFQGDRRAYERLQQTRDMIREEIYRVDQDILGQAEGYRPQQIAEARANRSQLNRLANNYDVVIKSFEKAVGSKTPKATSAVDPAVKSMSNDELKRQLGID